MQSDMSSTTTNCYDKANKTGEEIRKAGDLNNYVGQAFNVADLLNFGQIIAIKLMEEFDVCGFNNYLVTLDIALSKLPQTVGTLSNGITQIATNGEAADGEENSLIKGKDGLKTAWDNKNYQDMGKNYQLLVSSLLKYESPEAAVETLTFVGR